MAENNGDPFSLKNYQNLQRGFDRTNPFSPSSGSLTKSNIFGALSTLGSNVLEKASPVGAVLSAGNIYGNIKSEQAAAEAMKTDPKYGATLIGPTIQNMVNMAPSALSLARAEADTDGDGVVTNKESQNFGMSKGLTSYDPPNGDWTFIRNEPNAAQRQAKREQGWKWGDASPPKY